MRVIEGTKVDLISPFPRKEIRRLYNWMRSYKTSVFVDGSPDNEDEFVTYMEKVIAATASYGIIDKYNSVGAKHEAPIVGCIVYEPQVYDAYAHIASSRKAWGRPNPETKQRDVVGGLTYEGALLSIEDMFNNNPMLLRISAAILPWNKAARKFVELVGMTYEGRIRNKALQNGNPVDIVHYGLTRQDWEARKKNQDTPQHDVDAHQQSGEAPQQEDHNADRSDI